MARREEQSAKRQSEEPGAESHELYAQLLAARNLFDKDL